MRPIGTAAELERRRILAISRLQDGYSVPEVAEFLGVTQRAVFLWQAAFRRDGPSGVESQPPPPRPTKLTARQERTVLTWFLQSPKSFGFNTELWTGRRVAEVIRRKWGIEFNWRYLLTWLKRRDITPQKPQRRAREADRDAIDRWRSQDWPRLKNGRDASGPPLSSSTRAASC
jgi:transposase